MLLCDASQGLKRKETANNDKGFCFDIYKERKEDENFEVDGDHILLFTQN